MKKLLLALAIGTASLVSFSSCTKEYITDGDGYLPGVSFYASVATDQWVRYNGSPKDEFEIVLDFPELDQRYYEDGEVSVAIQYEAQKGVFHNVPASGVSRTNLKPGEVRKIHEYNASYMVGKVILKAYDETGNDVRPEDIRVKIILTDADIGDN